MNRIVRGFFIVLFAAFIWGIGNAVTGFTAQKYSSSGSLFPAIDIALANTFGGLFFLLIAFLINFVFNKSLSDSDARKNTNAVFTAFANKRAFLSGAFKGMNTCLFVFSTTYIVATKSLVFESTYIIWSLLLSILFLSRKVSLAPTILRVGLLSVGVILVSGQTRIDISTANFSGALFGLLAGLSYALFLFLWSYTTKKLSELKSQLAATSFLLTISSLTIIFLTEILSLTLFQKYWLPFTYLTSGDILLQTINGIFVVGVVYLLITIGMVDLQTAQEGASFIAAFCLSFSIPFTLLPEFVLHKFVPELIQIVGILLFMVGFILMSVNLSNTQKGKISGGDK